MTVAGLVDSYIGKHVRTLRSSAAIERRIRKNVVPRIGSVKLANLGRRDINHVVDPIVARGAPTEAARDFEDTRGMLRWAVARGELDHNPMEGMDKPSGRKSRDRALSRRRHLAVMRNRSEFDGGQKAGMSRGSATD